MNAASSSLERRLLSAAEDSGNAEIITFRFRLLMSDSVLWTCNDTSVMFSFLWSLLANTFMPDGYAGYHFIWTGPRLPSQSQSITAHWPIPSIILLGNRHVYVCERIACRVAAEKSTDGRRSSDLLIASLAP